MAQDFIYFPKTFLKVIISVVEYFEEGGGGMFRLPKGHIERSPAKKKPLGLVRGNVFMAPPGGLPKASFL